MAYTPNTAQWKKVTKVYTDFSTAGVTNNIEIYLLPVKGVIHAVLVSPTVAFAGGLIATYTISVGIAGTLAKYAPATNAFTGFTLPVISVITGIESLSGTTSIKASAISTVGNLSAATAGSVDFYLLISTLP